uniref:Pyrrolocin cluster transcription factor fsdR n=1 Tax=Fungal sp. (strain NRRL 50135) TaxID=1547289 RepID=PRLF_FUNXX|nr:RecName: Full=Pyrrolocin cluster transcription factor fsdR; AltName: Full=Pyrrolocin biosynthesis protein R [fungal sp. NRRL 50135]AIP87506.1 Zn2Cys6 transcription factor-like protein [fungal sp. NRRL 50135]
MALSPSSDAILSIRSSCDRCRSQKLKCIVIETPSGTACCQRCARAMVPCIFGRRSRSKRTTTTTTTTTTDSGRKQRRREPAAALNVLDSCAAPELAASSSSTNAHFPRGINGGMGIPEDRENQETGTFPFYAGCYGGSAPVTSAVEVIQGRKDPDRNLFRYAFQEESTIGDLGLFTHDMSLFGQTLDDASLANTEVMPPSLTESDGISSPGESAPFRVHLPLSEPGVAARVLLSFASDLHERLETLQNGPWQQEESSMGLDGYPIGSVLHLSLTLTDLGVALQKARSNDDASVSASSHKMDDGQTERVNPNSTQAGGISTSTTTEPPCYDTSVSLMLLSCYVTLLRVCTVVLGNFQTYLHLQPRARPKASPASIYPSSASCLGDLLPINQPHHRIHAAVCLLLDSLEQVEEALSLPYQVRCASAVQASSDPGSCTPSEAKPFSDAPAGAAGRDSATTLIHWGFQTSAAGMQDASSELRQKVEGVKEMLRQQMGL